MRTIKYLCSCGYETENKKSFSNHTRYGCASSRTPQRTSACKRCEKDFPQPKVSRQRLFCGQSCYMMWKKESGAFSGQNATNYKNGESRTRLYAVWLMMKARCVKQKCKDYKNYGGRGITVIEEWVSDFFSFKEWALGSGYSDNLTIERIDVNGHYEPSNCTWIPHGDQAKNRRNTKNNRHA